MKYRVTVWRVIEQVWEIDAEDEDDASFRWNEGKCVSEEIDPDDGGTFALGEDSVEEVA